MTEEITATESAEPATITLGEAPAETAEDTFVPREPTAPVHGWWWGTGRRKASVARVRVQPGSAGVLCNGKPLEEFFCTPRDRNNVMAVLEATNMLGQVSVKANLTGGGTTGQSGAMVMGLARALLGYDPSVAAVLREHGFLSRDARRVERKKYGQRGARRRFQFSKR
ncbi:MAG: 30S ribosomal protein S9 [Planctomycetota bacterium]|nr:30S ribosomal protein S9 [Planctomycetota bacterium]